MDWTTNPIKEKDPQVGAKSRSIVESLNLLNTVSKIERDKLNKLFIFTDDWINDSIKNLRSLNARKHSNDNSNSKNELIDNKMVSPEKTDPKLSLDNIEALEKTDMFITANPSPITDKTPSRAEFPINDKQKQNKTSGNDKNDTPISLMKGDSDNKTQFSEETEDAHIVKEEENINIDTMADNSNSVKENIDSQNRKPSPWSPFKVESTLRKAISRNTGQSINKESASNSVLNLTKTEIPKPIRKMTDAEYQSHPNQKIEDKQDLKPNLNGTANNEMQKEVSDIPIEDNNTLNSQLLQENAPHNSIANEDLPAKKNFELERQQNTLNRIKIRSNLFAPLPRKDPLIMKPASPNLPKKTSPILRANNAALLHQKNNPLTGSSPKRNISAVQNSMKQKKQSKMRVTKSPVPRSATKKTPGSVFERLSNIQTKSFGKKVHSKNIGNRKLPTSSIDVTGSPIRRESSKLTRLNQTDLSMQETLKSIFSTNKKNLASPTKISKPNPNNFRNMTSKSLRSTVQKPTDKLSQLDAFVDNKHVNLNHNDSTSSNSTLRITNNLQEMKKVSNNSTKTLIPTLLLSPSNKKISQLENTSGSPISSSKRLPDIRGSIESPSSNRQELIAGYPADKSTELEILNEKSNPNTTSDGRSIVQKDKKRDNFTKIQFLPPAESGKDDVKTKLNKRLSEVLRTQQENEKRRKEQKRKKSQLEDDIKRTQNIKFSDFKNYSKTYSITSVENANGRNISISNNNRPTRRSSNNFKINSENRIGKHEVIDTSNILGALATGDHRNMINANNHKEHMKYQPDDYGNDHIQVDGDDSLPDILSDVEQDTIILADWARSPNLQDQLEKQQNWDPKKIFGAIAPLHIEEIFPTTTASRLSKVKSTLSKKRT